MTSEFLRQARLIILTSSLASALVLGLRQFGAFQPLELAAFDLLTRLQSTPPPDPRLLVVAISEADLQAQQRWPLPDLTIAQAIAQLQPHRPTVIGLDLHRDLPQPPGQAQLQAQLQAPNLIAITKLGDSEDIPVPPPPHLPTERVGFNDLLLDPDGSVRRNLLFAAPDPQQPPLFAFSLRLALRYLAVHRISPRSLPQPSAAIQLGAARLQPLTPDAGSYQNLDARGYQILLRYRSPQPARALSLSQVLQGQFDPSWVSGKVVLIGTTAPSAKDLFFTPFSATAADQRKLAGVWVHAQMVSQLLSAASGERPLLWFWPEALELLWVLAWALLGGSLAWRTQSPWLLGLAGAALLAALLGGGWLLFTQQGWVPLAAPATAALVSGGWVVAQRAQQAQQQQQMVMRLLGQNTSPEIAQALWQARDRLLKSGKLPGQRLVATMLFSDLKDFSSLAEQLDPEALLEWLSKWLEVQTQEVQRHQGIINKFLGDGLMAVFGVPVARSTAAEIAEDARRAVACALAMAERLRQLNQVWAQAGKPVAQMRIGIYTGAVVVGSLGGQQRSEYGVIGDSVNIASRLESCLKERQGGECRVLIGQATLEQLGGAYAVESWGMLALKGKQQGVEVFRVLGPVAQSTHADTALQPDSNGTVVADGLDLALPNPPDAKD